MSKGLGILALIAGVGCSSADPPGRPAPRPALWPSPPSRGAPAIVELCPASGAECFRVEAEVARTAAQRARGLMFRRYLRPGTGMLFVYERPGRREFWMRNTYLRLDIIFIDAGGEVLGAVEDATPLRDEMLSVDGDAQFVLEVLAGFVREHQLSPGSRVRFLGLSEE